MARKPFEIPDHGLWDEVKLSIQPLKSGRSGGSHATSHVKLSPSSATMHVQNAIMPRTHMRHEPPPLAAFDRRTAQKLSRGIMEPDSRLDLHGESLETARMKLYHFVQSRHHDGHRLLLIITGKGASPYARHTLHGRELHHMPERDGRLRREVPLWLHEALFRTHVIGYQPAHPRHGGGGAFYVRLRRHGGDNS